jgi:hypothetical protein
LGSGAISASPYAPLLVQAPVNSFEFSASPDPLGSDAIPVSSDPLGSCAIPVSPDPSASGAIYAPTRLWSRAQSTPRPSLGLGARLSIHGGRTSDATCTMPSTLQQGATATILTTPITVAPYLCHCNVRHCPTVKRGMRGD